MHNCRARVLVCKAGRRSSVFALISDKPRDHKLIDPAARRMICQCLNGRADWPLFVYGPAGSGKTCIALSMFDLVGGWFADLPSFHELILSIKAGQYWYQGVTTSQACIGEFWDDWQAAQLTILDELGSRMRISDAQYETLKRAIDLRENKPAVYLSNLNLTELQDIYDDRISSRLAAGTVIELHGDRRNRK